MSRIVVFGGGGFIGQHLVRAFAQDNSTEVVAFDRFADYIKGGEHPFTNLPKVSVIAGDFLNRDDVSKALSGADVVFHLVSTTNPMSSSQDPFVDIDTNVRGSIELFQLCVKNGVKKVIFPSSGGTIYGDAGREVIDESAVPQPNSPYGIGKLIIEQYLRYFKRAYGLDYIVYRIANPYGPGQNIFGKQGVIPIFMHRFLVKDPVDVYGDGSMIRDYLYIDDLIQMIVESYDKPNKYNEYNLSSGLGVSINEIFNSIALCAGYEVPKQYLDTPPTFVGKSVLDNTRFAKEFGIKPKIILEQGIKRTWEYVTRIG